MRKNIGKSLSNLDLKLLDVKFITINDNQIYLTEALHQAKKSKKEQHLPSLLLSKDNNQRVGIMNDTSVIDKWQNKTPKNTRIRQTLQTSDYTDQSMHMMVNIPSSQQNIPSNSVVMSLLQPKRISHEQQYGQEQNQLQQVKELVQIRRSQQLSQHNTSTNNHILSLQKTQSQAELEEKQLEKYRKRIQLIKKQNLIIHNQISLLYRNKISQNKEQFKKVNNIEPFKMQALKTQVEGKNPFVKKQTNRNNKQILRIIKTEQNQKLKTNNQSVSQSKLPLTQNNGLSPLISQKTNFYENLSQNSPYKQQLEEIHKKMISNNFHKNFQQYLNTANKRVPEFIKKLKN